MDSKFAISSVTIWHDSLNGVSFSWDGVCDVVELELKRREFIVLESAVSVEFAIIFGCIAFDIAKVCHQLLCELLEIVGWEGNSGEE